MDQIILEPKDFEGRYIKSETWISNGSWAIKKSRVVYQSMLFDEDDKFSIVNDIIMSELEEDRFNQALSRNKLSKVFSKTPWIHDNYGRNSRLFKAVDGARAFIAEKYVVLFRLESLWGIDGKSLMVDDSENPSFLIMAVNFKDYALERDYAMMERMQERRNYEMYRLS